MTQISTTFKQEADKWLDEKINLPNPHIVPEYKDAVSSAIKSFASHLDSFQVLDDSLQLVAIKKSQEIDREVMFALASKLPKEQVQEIIKGIHEKHKHSNKYGQKIRRVEKTSETEKGEKEVK